MTKTSQTNAASSPFIVFGVSKSGTTWMQRIINAHPEICCHFQRPVFPISGELKSQLFLPSPGIKNKGVSAFGGVFEDIASEQDYLNRLDYISKINLLLPGFADDIAGIEPTKYFSEFDKRIVRNLVNNLLHVDTEKKIVGTKAYTDLDQLLKYFPDSKVIHIVRDGRDVAVSKRFHYLRMGAYYNGDEKLWPLRLLNRSQLGRRITKRIDRAGLLGKGWLNEPGENADLLSSAVLNKIAGEWAAVSNYIDSFAQKFQDNFLTIKYEDLRSKPLDEIEKIIEFLGGNISREILNSISEATNFKNQKQGGFFRKGVSGDWANHFTSQNRKDFSRITGNTLIRFGYEQDSSWAL